jgi:hypothetical protein
METPSRAASNYAAKLKDPRWQKKRLEALQLADWSCQSCGDGESPLHVHHNQYLKGREPWEYDERQLSVLCESCHKAHHDDPDVLMEVISHLPVDGMKWIDRKKAAALIAGVMGMDDHEVPAGLEAWFSVGLSVQQLVDKEMGLAHA